MGSKGEGRRREEKRREGKGKEEGRKGNRREGKGKRLVSSLLIYRILNITFPYCYPSTPFDKI